MIRWALLLTQRLSPISTPFLINVFFSSMKAAGSKTTPLPMIQVLPLWRMPDGIRWRTKVSWPTMTVCPALWPPALRTIIAAFLDKISTILPFTSSPHGAPTTTSVDMVQTFAETLLNEKKALIKDQSVDVKILDFYAIFVNEIYENSCI